MTREEELEELKALFITNQLTNHGKNRLMLYIETLQKKLQSSEKFAKKLQRELDIKNEALKLIKDIAFDYDGFNDVDNLKTLIDDLREIARRGINSKTVVMTKEQVLERIDK